MTNVAVLAFLACPSQVCDSVLNIGPIADVTIGNPDFISVSQNLCSLFIDRFTFFCYALFCWLLNLTGRGKQCFGGCTVQCMYTLIDVPSVCLFSLLTKVDQIWNWSRALDMAKMVLCVYYRYVCAL